MLIVLNPGVPGGITGDAQENHQAVSVHQRGGLALEIAQIVVIDDDVHVRSQLADFVEKMRLEPQKAAGRFLQRRAVFKGNRSLSLWILIADATAPWHVYPRAV